MEDPIESRKQPGSRILLPTGALLLLLVVCAGLPVVMAARGVVIKVPTNGVARVYGVRLGNGTLCQAALSVIARSRAAVQLDWESPGGKQTIGKPLTLGGATAAQLAVLHAIAKAGITNLTLNAK